MSESTYYNGSSFEHFALMGSPDKRSRIWSHRPLVSVDSGKLMLSHKDHAQSVIPELTPDGLKIGCTTITREAIEWLRVRGYLSAKP